MQVDARARLELVVEIDVGILWASAAGAEASGTGIPVEGILAAAAVIGAISVANDGEIDVVWRIGQDRHAGRKPEVMRHRPARRVCIADIISVIPAQHAAVELRVSPTYVVDLIEARELLPDM